MTQTTIRVSDSSNVGTTGLTGTEIKFRADPYGAGDVITIGGVSGGTNGIYLCDFAGVDYQLAQLWISGVYQATWGTKLIGDLVQYLVDGWLQLSGGTMSGAIAMGGSKITGAGAATTNGDLMRWEQTVNSTGNQTGIAGTKVVTGSWSYSPSTFTISGDGQFTSKKYVDDLFGGAVGVVQSTYSIKCLPSRAIEDSYSRTTPELCNSYLSGLSDIATKTGQMLIEPTGATANTLTLDDGTSQWISAGVWVVGQGSKPILNRRAPNSSLTVAGGIVNCRIKDGATGTPVVASRSYTNFTFQDCEFDVPDQTDITFTTCKFLGINKMKTISGNTITLTNCTGDMFWHSDEVTPVITGTQPNDVRAVTTANLNW